MANEFSTGLLQGFNFVDSIRQRRRQNDMEAQRLTIAKAAETRTQDTFEENARNIETIKAGRDAAFAVGDGEADELQQEMIEAAAVLGDPASIRRIEGVRQRKGLEQFIQSIPTQGAGGAGGAGGSATQSPGDQAAPDVAPLNDALQAKGEFTDPDQFEEPPPDVFGPEGSDPAGTRTVPASMIMNLLPEERQKQLKGGLLANVIGPMAQLRDIEIPAGALTEREIKELPVSQRKDAMDSTRELLSSDGFIDKSLRAEERQASVNEKWVNSFGTDSESEYRDLAATDPAAYTDQYWQDRNAITNDNDQNILDRQFMAIADEGIEQIATQMDELPRDENGFMDLSSDDAQALKTQLDHNIALRQAIQSDFNVLEEAGIRAGGFPTTNQELVDKYIEAIGVHGEPGKAPTSDKDRVGFAQGNRFVTNTNATRMSGGEAHWAAWAVQNGYLEISDLMNRLTTGSYSEETGRVFTVNPGQEIWSGVGDQARLIRSAIISPDPDLMHEMNQDDFARTLDIFMNLEGGSEADKWDIQRAQRNHDSFRVWVRQNIQLIRDNGIDPDRMDPNTAAQLVESYTDLVKLSNAYNNTGWQRFLPNFLGFGKNFERDIRTPADQRRVAQELGRRLTPIPRENIARTQQSVDQLRAMLARGSPKDQVIAAIDDNGAFLDAVERMRSEER